MQNRYLLNELKSALEFFDIEQKTFLRIHTQDLKKQYLRYKYLRKELAIIEASPNKTIDQLSQQLDDCERQYLSLINSEMIQDHKNIFSSFSRGLQEIDIRTIRAVGSEQTLDASVLEMKRKESGIEPGFEGIQTETILMHLDKTYPDKQTRREFLKRHRANIKSIYEEVKESVPKFLIKFAFEESQGDKLIPSERNIRQTQAVKKINRKNRFLGDVATLIIKMSKTTTITEKNIEAVREVFANDYARIGGMLVQDQVLYIGESDTGLLQLMPKGLWVNQASILGKLAGGGANSQYLVLSVVKAVNSVNFLSDYTIANLGRYLPVLLEEGDIDAIGSQAQNKLRLGNRILGIDFGHPFQANIIHKVGSDFHLADQNFKNYSIFYDRPRSEYVSGLLILAKLSGHIIDSRVVESYGQEFSDLYQAIVPSADTVLFSDYHRKFVELAASFGHRTEVDKKNKANCEAILSDLAAMQAMSKSSRQSLLDKFKIYLMLPSHYVDLLENLEKLMAGKANLAVYSEDRTVLLNYIRFIRRPTLDWYVDYDMIGMRWILKMKFYSEDARREAHQNLLKWEPVKNYHLNLEEGNVLALDLSAMQMDQLAELCSDQLIKTAYFPEDLALYQRYLNDVELQLSLRQLANIGINAQLCNDASRQDAYLVQMNFHPEQMSQTDVQEVIDESFSYFNLVKRENQFQICFDYTALPLITRLVRAVPEKLNIIKSIREYLIQFGALEQYSPMSAKYLTMSRSGYECELHISGDANPIFLTQLSPIVDRFLQHGRYRIPAVEWTLFMTGLFSAMERYSQIRNQLNSELASLEEFLFQNKLNESLNIQEYECDFIVTFKNLSTDDLVQKIYVGLVQEFRVEGNTVFVNYQRLSQLLPKIKMVVETYEADIAAMQFADEIAKRELELSQRQLELEARKIHLESLKSKNESANALADYLAKIATIHVELQKLIIDLQANSTHLPSLIYSTIGLFAGGQKDSHMPAGMLIDEIEIFIKQSDPGLYLADIKEKLRKRLDFVKEKNEQRYAAQIELIPIIISDLDDAIEIHKILGDDQARVGLIRH